jgi:hypothetical protein
MVSFRDAVPPNNPADMATLAQQMDLSRPVSLRNLIGKLTRPVQAPATGLGSNSNYILYSNCNAIINLSVTIDVTQDIASDEGEFSFQLNCYSPKNKVSAWQQYVIGFNVQGEANGTFYSVLQGAINNWPVTGNYLFLEWFDLTPDGPLEVVGQVLPAGTQLTITLENDASGNVIGTAFTVNFAGERWTVTQSLLSISGATEADLAPITAFELDLVGHDSGQSITLSSGAGTITYSASNQMTVLNQEPSCTESAYITAEMANSFYGTLLLGPSQRFTQSFSTSSARPMIRREGPTHILPPSPL